jgi:hypothetical protein
MQRRLLTLGIGGWLARPSPNLIPLRVPCPCRVFGDRAGVLISFHQTVTAGIGTRLFFFAYAITTWDAPPFRAVSEGWAPQTLVARPRPQAPPLLCGPRRGRKNQRENGITAGMELALGTATVVISRKVSGLKCSSLHRASIVSSTFLPSAPRALVKSSGS